MTISYATPQGDIRELLAGLIRCWTEEEPTLPPSALALALESAAEVDEYHRNREQMQLIWTGPDVGGLSFRRTEQALLELVQSATKSLLIVAFAAYKIPDLVNAINTRASSGVDVACVFVHAHRIKIHLAVPYLVWLAATGVSPPRHGL